MTCARLTNYPFANAGTDGEQQDDRAMIGAAEGEAVPQELAAG
jgi:hypothetical protein